MAQPALTTAPEAAEFTLPEHGGAESVTLSRKQLARETKLRAKQFGPVERPVDLDAVRPKTRGDCFGGERPCPFVGCKHHLYLEVTEVGSLVINRPDVDVADLKASCSLDIADQGGITLEQVGAVLNVTHERVRQIEQQALARAEVGLGADARMFRGSCKAVCARSGRTCKLPAHGQNVPHHDGRRGFRDVAEPGQTRFAEREEAEERARAVPHSAMEAAYV